MNNAKPILIFDWDCTLAEPRDRSFFSQHREKTKQSLKDHFDLTPARLEHIATSLHERKTRLEKLLSCPDLAREFNLEASRLGQYANLERSLNTIRTDGWFEPDSELVQAVRGLRNHYNIVVLSNSPEGLIRRIGKAIGFDMDQDFLAYYTLTAEGGPPKFVDADAAFQTIIQNHAPDLENSWSLGDSIQTDLEPARKIGMKTALVDNTGRYEPADHDHTAHGPIKDILDWIAIETP